MYWQVCLQKTPLLKERKRSEMENQLKKTSKFLSYILRHKPEVIGLKLSEDGWASVEELLIQANASGKTMTKELLEEVVATNDKKRFAFNSDKSMIRASQGHSLDIDLGYSEQKPPQTLFHGTVEKFMDSIGEKGLLKMNRHHVHLSEQLDTATLVGQRRGKPVILTIKAGEMYDKGYLFYRSANSVWLTDHAPPQFIER